MHITNCSEMDTFFNKAPDTALGLSLASPASPCKESHPLYSAKPATITNHSFNYPAGRPVLSFMHPSFSQNKLELDPPARFSPPAQLELLPLKPSPQKLSLSSAPVLHWQPPLASLSSGCMREIDMNQLPAVYTDRDEISESSGLLTMKRDRERSSDAEQERTCEVSSRGSDEEGEGGGSARKKLRLSKEQSTLLEESFKEHSTLNPRQKAELAKQLNLRPRQVEVWFQNRRARTKLKQTEVDCELLKRCCESLTEENRRLQKEVQELRAIKVAPPCVISHDRFMPLPAATLSICPSCERVASHVVPPPPVTASASQPSPSSSLTFSLSPTPPRQLHHHHIPLSFPPPPPPPQHALPSAAC